MDVEPVPTRIPELWFEDGNIVIQAGNSQFRVHRSILAACSPVFRDMLSFPQPPDSELVEGCPIVLLPDVPNEVTVFLKAIFMPNYFMPFPTITDYSIIKGCLRLSHKYQVEYLRVRALVHLSSRFRTTLVERDTSQFYGRMFLANRILSEMISWRVPPTEMYKISIIQLAREVEALWILPVAFYQLSTYVGASLRDRLASVLHGTVFDGVTISLSPQDQESFFNGHYSQTRASMTSMLEFLTSPLDIPDCQSPFTCPRDRLFAVDTALHEVKYYSPSVPLDMWDKEDWADLEKAVCTACLAALKTAHKTARQEFWEALPEIYGLPPWEDLEKMKVAAIGTHWLS